MLLAAGIIIAALVLAWGGLEADHFMHAYPGQSLAAVASVLILAFALAAARFRVANTRVPLWQEARPAPPPAAIRAAPVLVAIAGPHDEEAAPCEGPGCRNKVTGDPWTARVAGEEQEHAFCSEGCAAAWQPSAAPPGQPV